MYIPFLSFNLYFYSFIKYFCIKNVLKKITLSKKHELAYLISLHKEGNFSDSALDKALKSLKPVETTTPKSQDGVSTALENLRTTRRNKKLSKKQMLKLKK